MAVLMKLRNVRRAARSLGFPPSELFTVFTISLIFVYFASRRKEIADKLNAQKLF